jgi:hypothetical protein
MILFAGCKKEDPVDNTDDPINNTGLSNNPTAKSEHDHDAGGIYKGIVTGSAGYVYIHFKNSSNLVYAILNFDGGHDSLVCPGLNGYTFPGTTITNAVFTSALGTQDSIIFSVNGDGTNPSMTVKIPGHNTSTSILKESSTQELKVYQGDGQDTLVAGFYYCGTSVVNTLGSIRNFHITILVQGGNAVILPSAFLAPCPNNNPPNAAVVQVGEDNHITFEMGGQHINFDFTVTDTAVFGTALCPVPIDMGGEIDAYNMHAHAVRVQ